MLGDAKCIAIVNLAPGLCSAVYVLPWVAPFMGLSQLSQSQAMGPLAALLRLVVAIVATVAECIHFRAAPRLR
jgi:hypothetical protein